MGKLLKFNTNYFLCATILLAIEICIAKFAHDKIIRPYVGDFLVVILVYCLVKAFFNTPVLATAIGVLLFSYAVETAQYFNIVGILGLQNCRLAKIIIGSAFEWADIMVYSLGILVVIGAEEIVAAKARLK
jgi:Protein of unknown function (DUF2809)